LLFAAFTRTLLTATVALAVSACGDLPLEPSSGQPPATAGGPPSQPPLGVTPWPDALVSAVRDAYRHEFNEDVPSPAVANDPLDVDCTGRGYLTSTAFLPTGGSTRIAVLYMTRDGGALTEGGEGGSKYIVAPSLRPAGTFRVLTVFVEYPDTLPTTFTLLAQAQNAINAQHEAFARTRGYPSPIVRFAFTNVSVSRPDIADPRSPQGVRTAMSAQGIDISGFDFVATLNPEAGDPAGGGLALPGDAAPYFVYYGTGRALTSTLDVVNAAATLYHHEIGHHWGWRHDWTPSCGGRVPPFAPFITNPVLFGWEDTDGDGVPEILDATPYGRAGHRRATVKSIVTDRTVLPQPLEPT
jgi:hypothetical protein